MSAFFKVAESGISLYSGYQARSAALESARQQEAATNSAANAQRAAAAAQAQQLAGQAELAGIQARLEGARAGIAQQQGEIESRRRILQLNSDIGNAYAQWAGNGLLVDSGQDTLGQLLTANTREAAQDQGIIKTNTKNSVWEHDVNRTMALISQQNLMCQAMAALGVGEANAEATLLSGTAQAFATRQAGLTALYQGWGSSVSALSSTSRR